MLESVENAAGAHKAIVSDSTIFDLLDITNTDEPSETDCLLGIFNNAANGCKPATSQSSANILAFDFLKKVQGPALDTKKEKDVTNDKSRVDDKKATAWMDLFADLDPLANLTAMEKKIAGTNQNWLDA